MDNIRGSMLMVFSMLCFAIEDMFIKQMASAIPIGQILVLLSFGGILIFGSAAILREGGQLFSHFFHPIVVGRNLCDAFGTIGFLTAIALIPLSTASAILQATPLMVTLGAAIFFRESVGWRRWTATIVGLCGVLIIIRPGLEGFDARSLFAVMAVVGLGARDLFTRILPRDISTMKTSTYAFVTLIPTGVGLFLVQGDPIAIPDTANTLRLLAALLIGVIAYYTIVAATRVGDLSMISPFRYSRLVFALIIGVVAFGESPDALTLVGAAIIILAGLYTIMREARLRRASNATKALV